MTVTDDTHDWLHRIRDFELERVLAILNQRGFVRSRLLDIGAGTGFDAQQLTRCGYEVSAIDIPTSNLHAHRVWPVQDYDGRHIPFADEYFDVIFSSNVLEHVMALDELQREIARVLKPDGIVVHVVPSSAWRIWSSLAHYLYLIRRVGVVVAALIRRGPGASRAAVSQSFKVKRSLGERLGRVLFPGRHGERGNFITETYYFSTTWWRRHFERARWLILDAAPVGIFYTGYSIFGSAIPIAARRRLSSLAGSSTLVFVLQRAPA